MDRDYLGFKHKPINHLDFVISALKDLGLQVHKAEMSYDRADSIRWRGSQLLIQSDESRFLAIVRPSSGRSDRVLPLLALSLMEARKAASMESCPTKPLAVLVLEQATPALFKALYDFTQELAIAGEEVAVISMDGGRFFSSPELKLLNLFPKRSSQRMGVVSSSVNLFTDTNQWLLKVLFAEHIPEDLLSAPRGTLSSGRQLADVANVSHVSANRFLSQLKDEGFLDLTSDDIRLIRHEELLLRWRAAANGSRKEVAARFLFRANTDVQLKELVKGDQAQRCLGLFSAADYLNLGHVNGVAPYVYVHKLAQERLGQGAWTALMSTDPNQFPDLYIRQAQSPLSTFNGAVIRKGALCTDVIQVWLDVSYHPARGLEQADLIYEKYLLPIFKNS